MEVQALPRSLARLVGDTLYGIQKEYARAVLVAGAGLMFDSLRAVLAGQTVGKRPDRTQILQAAVDGVLLAFAAAASEFSEPPVSRATALPPARPRLSACNGAAQCPAPPPPPPPLSLATLAKAPATTVRGAVFWCRDHPLQLSAAVGALILADWLNVAISFDRLDPFVGLARWLTRPIARLGRWVSSAAGSQRARTLRQVASFHA